MSVQTHCVRVRHSSGITEYHAPHGTLLLEVLQHGNGLHAPCGGRSTCGKCRVKPEGILAPADHQEALLLGPALEKGWRLACLLPVTGDMTLTLMPEGEALIETRADTGTETPDPWVTLRPLSPAAPDLRKPVSDLTRLRHTAGAISSDLSLVSSLPALMRQSAPLTGVFAGNTLVSVMAGAPDEISPGVAVDIGTTTLAAYLADTVSGKVLATRACMNPQRRYGADVISRTDAAARSPEALAEVSACIRDAIRELIRQLCDDAGLLPAQILHVVLAGNTIMLHLLAGANPSAMARAPFIPVFTETLHLRAAALSMPELVHATLTLLPSVAAYLGADITAAVMASGLDRETPVTLLADIGTNGEMVLGNVTAMTGCSVAAGPAFEGAHITAGMPGLEGAVCAVAPDLSVTVLGGGRACGICGSGLVDLLARLLALGIVDITGRLLYADEWENPQAAPYASRLTDSGGQPAFTVVPATESLHGEAILLTQKDIRQLQNAKAAICAGAETLAALAGCGVSGIERVFLAGGFGSSLNPDSAVAIGMFPPELSGRITALGNAAGAGALRALLFKEALSEAVSICESLRYVELSGDAQFTDLYVERMMFGEEG